MEAGMERKRSDGITLAASFSPCMMTVCHCRAKVVVSCKVNLCFSFMKEKHKKRCKRSFLP